MNKEAKYFRNAVFPTPPIPKAGPVRLTRKTMAELYSLAMNFARAIMVLFGLLYRSIPSRFRGVDRSWTLAGHASCVSAGTRPKGGLGAVGEAGGGYREDIV